MAKAKGPTEAQIEAARKLREKKDLAPPPEVKPPGPAQLPSPPGLGGGGPPGLGGEGPPGLNKPEDDPRPQPVVWSGKDEDFPAWVQADMRYKEQYSAWATRQYRKTVTS